MTCDAHTVLFDEGKLGTDFHGGLVGDESVTTIMIEPVKDAVQGETVCLGREQSHHVTTEVIGAFSRQRRVTVEELVLKFQYHVTANLQPGIRLQYSTGIAKVKLAHLI